MPESPDEVAAHIEQLIRDRSERSRCDRQALLQSLLESKVEVVPMPNFTAVVERCPDTGFFVGYVPGFPGGHSQGETLEELNENLREVIAMILLD